jgi:large subunit ribosomal protein L21
MYAVVRTGGKQYRVAQGDQLRIEKINGEVGQDVTFDDVLMLGDTEDVKIGKPVVEGAAVKARILEQDRARKIVVFKFKRRKGYEKKQGHRQSFTRVEITGIQAS